MDCLAKEEELLVEWVGYAKLRTLLASVINFVVRTLELSYYIYILAESQSQSKREGQGVGISSTLVALKSSFTSQQVTWQCLTSFFLMRVFPSMIGFILLCAVLFNNKNGCILWIVGEVVCLLGYAALNHLALVLNLELNLPEKETETENGCGDGGGASSGIGIGGDGDRVEVDEMSLWLWEDSEVMACLYCFIRVVTIILVYDFIQHLKIWEAYEEKVRVAGLRNHFWYQLALHHGHQVDVEEDHDDDDHFGQDDDDGQECPNPDLDDLELEPMAIKPTPTPTTQSQERTGTMLGRVTRRMKMWEGKDSSSEAVEITEYHHIAESPFGKGVIKYPPMPEPQQELEEYDEDEGEEETRIGGMESEPEPEDEQCKDLEDEDEEDEEEEGSSLHETETEDEDDD